jgi:hypothetical protein
LAPACTQAIASRICAGARLAVSVRAELAVVEAPEAGGASGTVSVPQRAATVSAMPGAASVQGRNSIRPKRSTEPGSALAAARTGAAPKPTIVADTATIKIKPGTPRTRIPRTITKPRQATVTGFR